MKTVAFLVAAGAALASAQATYNETTGKFTCAKPNVAYCAGDSLKTDIIIRCDSTGVGQPGRCSDNLDGEPPVGDSPALCWQTSTTSGDAACEKNCIVYGGSGNANGTFPLPTSLCQPTFTASTSSAPPTSSVAPPTSTAPGAPTSTTLTTVTSTSTTDTCPPETTAAPPTSTSVPPPLSTGPSGPAGGNNGTFPTTSGSATNTPPPPTKATSPPPVVTAGATANSVGAALAVVGLAAAYFL